MSDLVKQLRTKATMISLGERRSEESERRVSACVNACEGFSTESLELPEFFSATMRGYRVMVEEGEARIAELEAQIDELLSGIDKALTMYVTGQPMQFVADKLAEVYDKIEAEKAE